MICSKCGGNAEPPIMQRAKIRLGIALTRLFYALHLIPFDAYFNAMVQLYSALGILRVKFVDLEERMKDEQNEEVLRIKQTFGYSAPTTPAWAGNGCTRRNPLGRCLTAF